MNVAIASVSCETCIAKLVLLGIVWLRLKVRPLICCLYELTHHGKLLGSRHRLLLTRAAYELPACWQQDCSEPDLEGITSNEREEAGA